MTMHEGNVSFSTISIEWTAKESELVFLDHSELLEEDSEPAPTV
jgi:hypothetical protein